MSLTPFTAPKFLCKNSIWDTKGKADVLVSASRLSWSRIKGCTWTGWGAAVPRSLAVDGKRLVPPTVMSALWDGLHKSFRWRISQTIRFRKYGMCCCRDTDTLLIFTLVGTLLLSPYSLSSYSFQPTDTVIFLVFQTTHSWLHVAFSSHCCFLLFPLCGFKELQCHHMESLG